MSVAKRPLSVVAALATAATGGALVALVTASFIWLVENGTELVWVEAPKQLGVDAYESWWLFAVLVGGGVLVGLTQRYLGRYPAPIDQVMADWRAGHPVEPKTVPRSAANALTVLVLGGPVGFEAALTGIIGGSVRWVGNRIAAVDLLVRDAWGDAPIDAAPKVVRSLPVWVAAIAGLITYRWLPFGMLDLGFRYSRFDGDLSIGEGAAAVAFAAVVVVPVSWALSVVQRAERSHLSDRSPVLFAMGAGLVFAVMALGNEYVLFSGQQAIQHLPGLGTGTLVYLTIAKWAALVIALYAGWRGGPIFPTYVAVASSGVLLADALGVRSDVVVVAGLAAVGVVFLKGSVPAGFILTLYAAPFSYAGVILIGATGGAIALAIAGSKQWIPRAPEAATVRTR